MHNRQQYLLLFIILLVGIFLRVFALDRVPFGFFCDEASIGYNAYSILNTGTDEYGKSFPIFFQSFGDYRHPIAIYSAIPFILIFGLTEMSTRLTSATYGILTLLLLYLLGKKIYSPSVGLWSAFVAALMPWLIHYNRVGFEFSSYVFFYVLSLYLWIKGFENKRFIPFACFISGITAYTYQSAKLIIPLTFITVIFMFRKTLFRACKETLIGIILFLILLVPLIYSFFNGQATVRFNLISIFSKDLSIPNAIFKSFGNYFTQLSPAFLFLSGEGNNMTRHFIEGLLPLLLVSFPFLVIGIIMLIIHIKKPLYQLLFFWLVIFPLSGAVVYESPFTSRSIIGAPLLSILIALGITYSLTFLRKRSEIFYQTIRIFIVLSFLLNFLFFLNFYFNKYPLFSSGYMGWQYGPRDIIAYFVKNQAGYDDEIMIGEFNAPEIFFKFYAPQDCLKCKIGTPEILMDQSRKQLFAVTPEYLANHSYKFIIKKTLYYPNKRVAFQIGEVVQ